MEPADFWNLTDDPTILFVNDESRAIALKSYTLAFSEFLIDGPRYFNFDIDSISFATSEDLQRAVYPIARNCMCNISKPTIFEFELFTKLKYLVVCQWKPRKQGESITMTLDNFTGLESFTCGMRSWSTMNFEPRQHAYGLGWEERKKKPLMSWLTHLEIKKLMELTEDEEKRVEQLPEWLEGRRRTIRGMPRR